MVPRLFPGRTIVCLGSGPSLTPEDIAACRQAGCPIVAVNDTYQLAPDAAVVFAADFKWWRWHPAAQAHAGLKYMLSPQSRTQPLNTVVALQRTGQRGFEPSPTGLRSGGHSGYAAVNLAAHLVGTGGTILLLGYDMQPAGDGAHHFFGDHPDRTHPRYDRWRGLYAALLSPLAAHGIRLINVTRVSAIPTVPRRGLAEALACVI